MKRENLWHSKEAGLKNKSSEMIQDAEIKMNSIAFMHHYCHVHGLVITDHLNLFKFGLTNVTT